MEKRKKFAFSMWIRWRAAQCKEVSRTENPDSSRERTNVSRLLIIVPEMHDYYPKRLVNCRRSTLRRTADLRSVSKMKSPLRERRDGDRGMPGRRDVYVYYRLFKLGVATFYATRAHQAWPPECYFCNQFSINRIHACDQQVQSGKAVHIVLRARRSAVATLGLIIER